MVSILTGLMEAIYTELFIYIYRVFTLVKLYISLKTQLIKGGFYEAKGAKQTKKCLPQIHPELLWMGEVYN